jgi:uncharacterized protein
VGWAPAAGAALPPVTSAVEDHAGVLSPEQEETIRARLTGLERDRGIQAVVVTIGSIADYDPGRPTIEAFATRLFNEVGIGDPQRNDGAMLLVAVADRRVRIEVGSGYGHRRDAAMQRVIDRFMVPRFKAGDYGDGVVAGAEAMAEALGGSVSDPPAAGAEPADLPAEVSAARPPEIHPVLPPSSLYIPSLDAATVLGGLAAAGLVFLLLRLLRRFPRRCPECKLPMIRLPEAMDDEHLDGGQRAEETLASVDYVVWLCQRCGATRAEARRKWFYSHWRCSRCGYLTVDLSHTTLTPATETACGTQEVVEKCHHCDFEVRRLLTLPRLTPAITDAPFNNPLGGFTSAGPTASSGGGSSSGAGSSGGGRSSGGGASGSW